MPRGDYWKHWIDRLEDGSILNPTSGCIEWKAAKNSRGYGVIYFEKKLQLAHRAAWLRHYGSWPDPDMVIDHICNNKSCVNVEHLRELTSGQNIMRATPRGDTETERKRALSRAACRRYRAKVRARKAASIVMV